MNGILLTVLLGGIAVALFVVPTIYQLVDDRRTQRSRSFSHVPCRIRHAVASALRLGIIVVAVLVAQLWSWAPLLVWPLTGVLLLATLLIARSDKRLRIDGDTGLVTWTKMSNPLSGRRKVLFVDDLAPLSYERKREVNRYGGYALDLWTLGTLPLTYSCNYNGGQMMGGVFSENAVRELCERVNAYLEAFKCHDTAERHQRRRQFREQYERTHAPALSRREARARRQAQKERAATAREQRRREAERARAQQAEADRRRSLEDKFRERASI